MTKQFSNAGEGTDSSIQIEELDKLVTTQKYLPLARFLLTREESHLKLKFDEIERVIGQALPASARDYRAWWANDSSGSHVQASAWLGIGWRVEAVDLRVEFVQFVR